MKTCAFTGHRPKGLEMCIRDRFNMTQGQLTAISTVGQLPGAFFSIWLGHMFDKKGVRMLPGILLALAAACQIWRIFATDYVSLFIITFPVSYTHLVFLHCDPRWLEFAGPCAKAAADAEFFINIDDACLLVNAHCGPLFRAGVVAGMVITLLAGHDGVHHGSGPQIDPNAAIAWTRKAVVHQAAHDGAGLTACAQ